MKEDHVKEEPETTEKEDVAKQEIPEDNEGDEEEETETAVKATTQDVKNNIKDEAQEKVEDTFTVADEVLFNMDDIQIPENEDKAEFVEMLMNVMHAGITIYLAINYWYTYLPKTVGLPFNRHLPRSPTVLPLFKPVSIAMWPALMPLLQFAHWQATRKKPLNEYQDGVLPGTQPFAMNWLSLTYAYLVGVCWLVYMLAT